MLRWISDGLLQGRCLDQGLRMRRRVRSGLWELRELSHPLRLLYGMLQRMDGLEVIEIKCGEILSSRCGVLRREISPSSISI